MDAHGRSAPRLVLSVAPRETTTRPHGIHFYGWLIIFDVPRWRLPNVTPRGLEKGKWELPANARDRFLCFPYYQWTSVSGQIPPALCTSTVEDTPRSLKGRGILSSIILFCWFFISSTHTGTRRVVERCEAATYYARAHRYYLWRMNVEKKRENRPVKLQTSSCPEKLRQKKKCMVPVSVSSLHVTNSNKGWRNGQHV